MFFDFSDSSVETVEDCLKKDLLTYVTYAAGKRCFSFPQFCFDKSVVKKLAPSVFPDRGCLPMAIADMDSYGLRDKYGEIVVMNVNRSDIQENQRYSIDNEPDVYNGVINPAFSKGKSQIEFTSFGSHQLSSKLIQVISLTEPAAFEAPINRSVHTCPDKAQPMSKLVLVSQEKEDETYFYGPFEYTASKDGGYKLSASSDYGALIAVIDESVIESTIELLNDEWQKCATFVDSSEIRERFGLAKEKYDWVKDGELVEAIGRLARLESVGLSKNNARALKDAISTCSEAEAKIAVSDSRRMRMEALLGGLTSWSQLADEDRKGVIESADPAELAQYVLYDANFSTFFDKVMEDGQIRARVEEQRRSLTEETEKFQSERDEAKREADEAKKELDNFAAKRDELRANLFKEAEAEAEQARLERDGLKEESQQLRKELESLDDQRAVIKDQVRRLVRNMTDETVVREKILEDSMIKQIVSALSEPECQEAAPDASDTKPEEQVPSLHILKLEQGKKKERALLEEIADRLTKTAGREFQDNEIENLLVCVTQGYITTLSGLPGTGKTSLANALGAALGLKNPSVPRFVQVAVERGWTSYKDLIGYFNPLTGAVVKSSPELFDMMLAADSEAREGDSPAPWLVLLDEANLSSVEHYWSPFLGSCDSFAQESVTLSLGEDSPVLVPSSMRFLATVNFDHTTEELSPRFLDRSWVISLETSDLDIDTLGECAKPDLSFSTIGFGDLLEVFGYHAAIDVPESFGTFRTRLREVLDICARHNAPVSARSQQMMIRYIAAASRVMNTASANASYAPVDYAVSQKILPTLSGPEDTMRGLIDDLKAVGGLPITKRRLERMSKAGEDSGFFQFFV